jgi:hypothetical protein
MAFSRVPTMPVNRCISSKIPRTNQLTVVLPHDPACPQNGHLASFLAGSRQQHLAITGNLQPVLDVMFSSFLPSTRSFIALSTVLDICQYRASLHPLYLARSIPNCIFPFFSFTLPFFPFFLLLFLSSPLLHFKRTYRIQYITVI